MYMHVYIYMSVYMYIYIYTFEEKHNRAKSREKLRDQDVLLELVQLLVHEGVDANMQNQKRKRGEERPIQLRRRSVVCYHQ